MNLTAVPASNTPVEKWRHTLERFASDIGRIYYEFDILNQIDRTALQRSNHLSGVIERIGPVLSGHFSAPGEFLLKADQGTVTFPFGGEASGISHDLIFDAVEPPLDEKIGVARIVTVDDTRLLVLRVFWTPKLKCVMFFRDQFAPPHGPSRFESNLHFAELVVDQMTLLVGALFEQRASSLRTRIADTFFDHGLQAAECWNAVVAEVAGHVMSWRMRSGEEGPRMQLLLKRVDEMTNREVLDIVGTNGKELESRRSIPVPVEDSVCGMVVRTDPAPDYALFDLACDGEAGRVYKGFLLSSGGAEGLRGTELVVPIFFKSSLIGVFNFEHPASPAQAFDALEIHNAVEAATILAPYIHGLRERHAAQSVVEANLLRTVRAQLQRVSVLYEHKLAQPIFIARMALDKILRHLGQGKAPEQRDSQALRQAIANFQEFHADFSDRLTRLVDDTRLMIVADALDEARNLLLRSMSDDIAVDTKVHGGRLDYSVVGSPMMVEHLFNILGNARDSINDAIGLGLIEPNEGRIMISVDCRKVSDSFGKDMGGNTVEVRISDNGKGIPPDEAGKLGKQTVSSKKINGHGIGVAEASHYFESLGGSFEIANADLEPGAVVTIVLPGYPDNLAGE